MQKILLYYKFTPIEDPDAIMLWQKNLTSSLELLGRIIISPHGINGTVGGELNSLKLYIKETKQLNCFKDIIFKWSDGGRENFPRLSVRVRPEIVAFDAADELRVNEDGVIGGGTHLKPIEVNTLVATRNDVIFFDGRNTHEAVIGKFKNAIVPNTRTSRDFITELESGKYDDIKEKPIITYCTGGIRCEILSSLMINRGFKEVYQIDGGIVTYGKDFGDDGLWEGSLRVFDDRMAIEFSEHAKIIGECSHCTLATSNYENCAWTDCNDLVLICKKCKIVRNLLFHTDDCRTSAAATIEHKPMATLEII